MSHRAAPTPSRPASRGPLPATLALVAAGAALAGPVWEEANTGDAGRFPNEAQQTTGGTDPLQRIKGELAGTLAPLPDFEDMYLIRICDAEAFFASTHPIETGLADFDTQLWLFRPVPGDPVDGIGVVGNDDRLGPAPFEASKITGVPTDGSPPELIPGLYFLAITGSDRDPASGPTPSALIFDQEIPTEISGPDGPGSPFPLTHWLSAKPSAVGSYEIALAGVTFGSSSSIDCNGNGRADICDILSGESPDANGNGVPDECDLPGDIDGDGDVDFTDLLATLAAWGPCPGPPDPCPWDLNGDGMVGFGDLLILLAAWTG